MSIDKKKILLIADFPPPEGGVTILVKLLANFLSNEKNTKLKCIDTMLNGKRSSIKNRPSDLLYGFIIYIFKVFFEIYRHNVVTIHLPSNKLGLYALPALIFSKLFRKRLILRKFGGTDFYKSNWLIRTITDFVIRHSYKYLCETKELVIIANEHGIFNAEWFPNHREVPQIFRSSDQSRCTNFIYVGQIREEKGLIILAEALHYLPEDSAISVTLFGPICDNVVTEEYISQVPHMKYGGVLPSSQIHEAMAKFDCFIFPSFWPGEGYPGALIEALSIGLPAIVSNWGAINEVCFLDCAISVPVKDSNSLYEAILRIHNDINMWNKMSSAAKECGRFYSADKWTKQFLIWCN